MASKDITPQVYDSSSIKVLEGLKQSACARQCISVRRASRVCTISSTKSSITPLTKRSLDTPTKLT